MFWGHISVTDDQYYSIQIVVLSIRNLVLGMLLLCVVLGTLKTVLWCPEEKLKTLFNGINI